VAALAAALLAFSVSGCRSTATPPAPTASPAPTSVKDADPCSFLEQSVVSANVLERASADTSTTSRSCTWTSETFTTMVLARWDPRALVDFTQAFPVLVDSEVVLGGHRAVFGKSDVRPACAAVLFAEQGTVVEIVVGDKPPSTADAACERVKTIGGAVVAHLRDQDLLDDRPAPSTTS
jgi:hypothetical protein